jgi:uncharacterized membrane protein YphA (DoxX/SURF4 family)
LAGLLLRLGLGLVLVTWAYDIHFNPVYYGHVLHGQNLPTLLLLLGLGLVLVAGRGARVAAVLAAATFAFFAVGLEGHQPVGLPQNAGLAAGALALAILGPGKLSFGTTPRTISRRDLLLTETILRTGLALTFFLYGFSKFAQADEYRIVVAEVPLVSLLAHAIGAQATVNMVGLFELLTAVLMLLPSVGVGWGAALQTMGLTSFVVTLGYPFSFPQDLGLMAVIGALVALQALRLPVMLRRTAPRVWLGRLAFDQRLGRPAARNAGAVLVLRVEGLADVGGAATERVLAALQAAAQRVSRPNDICALAGADSYCLILPTVTTPDTLEAVVRRLGRLLATAELSRLAGRSVDVAIGRAHWGDGVGLAEALALADRHAAAVGPAGSAALAPAA